MNHDETRKNRIISYALRRIMSTGASGLTMDDIARGVGMGKGTLYRLFPSKEALILEAVAFFEISVTQELGAILDDENLDPNEKLSGFLQAVAGRISSLRPEALSDIARSMPEVYERIEQSRWNLINKNLVNLLADGKRSGLYNKNMDERLVVHAVIGAVSHLTEPEVITSLGYTLEELFKALFSIILNGCLSREENAAPDKI